MAGGTLETPTSTRPSQYAARSSPEESCEYFGATEAEGLHDKLTWSLIGLCVVIIYGFANIAISIPCATVRTDREVLVERPLACM